MEHRLSGQLRLTWGQAIQAVITLDEGRVVHVHTPARVTPLGELLVEMGLTTSHDLADALSTQPRGILLGQHLLRRKTVDHLALRTALAEQIAQRIVWACDSPPRANFEFYRDSSTPEGLPTPLDGAPALWLISRCSNTLSLEHIRPKLTALGQRWVSLHPNARLDLFDAAPSYKAALQAISHHALPLTDLLAQIEEPNFSRWVYLLLLLKHLDYGDAEQPLGVEHDAGEDSGVRPLLGSESDRKGDDSDPDMVLPPPPSYSFVLEIPSLRPPGVARYGPGRRKTAKPVEHATTLDTFRTELEAFELRSRELAHHEILEVPETANQEQIRAAYQRLAKKWDPSSLPPDCAELVPVVSQVLARIKRAKKTLMSQVRKPPTVTPSALPSQRTSRVSSALHQAQQAWRSAQSTKSNHLSALSAPLQIMNVCVRQEPGNVEVRYLRGRLLSRVGHHQRAKRDFNAVLKVDPKHDGALSALAEYQRARRSSLS